jgi:hypothetical protein
MGQRCGLVVVSDVGAGQLGRNQLAEVVGHWPALSGGEVFECRPAVSVDPHTRWAIQFSILCGWYGRAPRLLKRTGASGDRLAFRFSLSLPRPLGHRPYTVAVYCTRGVQVRLSLWRVALPGRSMVASTSAVP